MPANRSAAPARCFRSPAVGLVVASLLFCGCAKSTPSQRLSTIDISLGGRTIAVEVARTESERQTGMMHRKEIGPDEGMLFVFPAPQPLHFYMRNTLVPLSIAFLRSDGVILNIAHMEPLSLKTHSSRLPCRFALEMPQGWFEKHGVKEGDRIELPPEVMADTGTPGRQG